MAPRQGAAALMRTKAQSGRKRHRGEADGPSKKRRNENEILSSDEDEDLVASRGMDREEEDDREVEEEESADAKRIRVAKAYLDRVKAEVTVDDPDALEADENEVADGERDTLVAHRLMQEQREEGGRALRLVASRVQAGKSRPVGRRHRQAVTAVTLTGDDSQAFAASKDGMVVQWNVETEQSTVLEWPAPVPSKALQGGRGKPKRQPSRNVLALAASSDGRYLAAGGLDRHVHIWDIRTGKHVQAFAGHRGAVAGLAFRIGTHQLFSGSYDRSIKIWSVDDLAYMDSLYGHQSEVIAVDCLRTERVLSAGRDRTCRIWKVPEETQLVLRGHSSSIDCCALITPNDFISGSEDGSIALWSALRKKPVHIVRGAHGVREHGTANGVSAHENGRQDSDEEGNRDSDQQLPNGTGTNSDPYVGVGGAAQGWAGSVAVWRGSDLAASGAADGRVRLWRCDIAGHRVEPLHNLPNKGFVNSLAFANSGRFLLAGGGQEPRLGRWGRIGGVRNGVVLHPLETT